jgi:ATP/maltotriose-dependent transcriptional regulator MalT
MGEKALLAGTAVMLAQALFAQDRHEEAAEFCRVGAEAAAEDDASAQVGWRAVRAKLLAVEGASHEALALAEEAVRLAAGTDFLTIHAEALLDQGEVLRRAGRETEATAAVRAGEELYRRKGDVVSPLRRTSDGRLEAQHGEVRERRAS